MKKIVILLGPPGSGKSTQRLRVIDKYNLKSISTGDLAREISKKNKEAAQKVGRGELLPDDIMIGEIKSELKDIRKNVIFDGFPRDKKQAKGLDLLLEEMGSEILAIYLDVSKDEIIRRLTTRYVCQECRNISTKPGKCECGGTLVKRKDDKEEIILERIKVFKEHTEPLLEYYKKRDELIEVDGEGSFDVVTKRVEEVLDDYFKE